MCDSVHNHARCLLSPILLHLKIMQETCHDHGAAILFHWWKAHMQPTICRRHLSYGRQHWWTSRRHQQTHRWWTSRRHQQTRRQRMACGMEVSTEKSKIMTNSTNNSIADIGMNGQKLEEVTSLKYLGATLCKDGTCSAEICIRIASAMAAMARLNGIWHCNTISFNSKFKLCKSRVTCILLYGCETWTLLADSEKRIQAFETDAWGNFSASPTWNTRPTTGCGAISTSLWVNNNFLQ